MILLTQAEVYNFKINSTTENATADTIMAAIRNNMGRPDWRNLPDKVVVNAADYASLRDNDYISFKEPAPSTIYGIPIVISKFQEEGQITIMNGNVGR